MRTRFIARLLSDEDALLAWAEVWAEPKPQEGRASCPLFAVPSATRFVIEADGTVAKVAVHWPDLDIARVRSLDATPVQAYQVFEFLWLEPVWLVAGMANVVLPAVTVRAPIQVAPPTGVVVGADSRR